MAKRPQFVFTVWTLILCSGAVSIEGELIVLTKTEFGTLQFLTRNVGTTFSRQQIVEGAHGADYPATDRTVDVQRVALRKKLGSRGKPIKTVRGKGYWFSPIYHITIDDSTEAGQP